MIRSDFSRKIDTVVEPTCIMYSKYKAKCDVSEYVDTLY